MRKTLASAAAPTSAPSSSPVMGFTVALVLFIGLSATLYLTT